MPCRSCGREGYADICSECMFREQNQQCWRCRMYIPKAEMQQWRGQWICPNCRMDLDREEEETGKERKGIKVEEEAAAELYEKKGKCDRCSRDTIILYRFNGRNLCWYCLEKEDTYAGAGGTGGAIPIQLVRGRKKKRGILKRIKEYFFGKEPEGEAEVEISVARVVPIRKKGKESDVVPVKKGEAEIVPKKGEEPKKEHTKEEKRGKGPIVEKEKGEPPEEEKKKEKEGKKRPDWGEWKKD